MFEDDVEFMETSDIQWNWFYKAECGVWQKVEVIIVCIISLLTLMSFHFIAFPLLFIFYLYILF